MKTLGIPIRVVGASHGNLNYLVNLAICLRRLGTHWQPLVLTSLRLLPVNSLELLEKSGVAIMDLPYFSQRPAVWNFIRATFSSDPEVHIAAERGSLDCIFENAAFYGRDCRVPALHWIPDLQHRELPEMFPLAARLKRELLIRCVLMSERSILMSSADARDAMLRHYAIDANRLHIAQFASTLIGGETVKVTDTALTELGISAPFAFIPNQFWRHKNHLILPRTARMLAERAINFTFVCTGEQNDPRSSEHFSMFNRLLDEFGVRDRFIIPGLVPYTIVRSLHRECAMLINPSFVEGWNTGVEEAKFLGSHMVLSDIGTHREQVQNYERAILFDPYSPASLTNAIMATLNVGPISCEDRLIASRNYDSNIRDFVDAIEIALDQTTNQLTSPLL